MCKCRCCKKDAKDIKEYIYSAKEISIDEDEYIRRFEGTYDPLTNSFLCTSCYINSGMPLNVRG